jgi:alpha-methylacyl-CoA racemase
MLNNLVLLDFSSIGPGPRCTRLLADYGMRIVKIRPPVGGTRTIDAAWYAYSANRGIPQLHVDLKTDEGRGLVRRMLGRSDGMIESYRPGVAQRLGLGYDDARAANGSIVYCSVSGYGQRGPYAHWPAHDLNWLALGGFLHCGSRRGDGAPALPGGVVADAVGGYSAAAAVLAALLRRASTGEGAYLDVSVIDGVLRVMQVVLDGQLAGDTDGACGPDTLLTGGSACYDVYPAADGKWLAVAAIEPHFWQALCAGLGIPERIPDQHDPNCQAELRAEMARVFATRPRDEWFQLLGPVTCVSPVNSPAEALADPHLNGRPLTIDVRVGERAARQLAPRLPVPDSPDVQQQPAGPTPPDQVDATLQEFGLSPQEVADLRRSKAVTDPGPSWPED